MELIVYGTNFYQWERRDGKKLKDKLFVLQRFQDAVIPKCLFGDIPTLPNNSLSIFLKV